MTTIQLEVIGKPSTILTEKDILEDKAYKLESLKTYVALAYAMAASNFNFDIFSMIKVSVRIYDFVFLEMTCGISYAFMDFFIKQYTSKVDFGQSLNPLLKGVNIAIGIQTSLWAVLHATDLINAVRYFVDSLYPIPVWSLCHNLYGKNCVSLEEALLRCHMNKWTSLSEISTSHYYEVLYETSERLAVTMQIFTSGVIWLAIFFMSTVSATTLIKYTKLSFMARIISTLFTAFFMFITKGELVEPAISDIMNMNHPFSYVMAIDHVASSFCIGLIGVYDYGSMSPYTLTDNAVVVAAIVITSFAFIRSVMMRIVFLTMRSCIKIPDDMRTHFVTFVLIPAGIQMLHAQRLLAIYLYSNMIISVSLHLTLMVTTYAKMLHGEFRIVKDMYIVGVMCFLGFCFTIPVILVFKHVSALKFASAICMLYLGGLKTAIIMWLYGMKKFSTDIEFWLGFKPTYYWKICWMCLPMVLLCFTVIKLYDVYNKPFDRTAIIVTVWFSFMTLVVLIYEFKTLTQFMMLSNFIAAFKSSKKYGPPSAADRKNRKIFNEATRNRKCEHDCMFLDERIQCTHEMLDDIEIDKYTRTVSEQNFLLDTLKDEETSLKRRRMTSDADDGSLQDEA